MARAFDGDGQSALIFEARTRQATGVNASLFVYKMEEKVRVFVIDVFYPRFFEPAKLLFGILLRRSHRVERDVGRVPVVVSHLNLWVLLLCRLVAALFFQSPLVERHGVFVQFYR